MKRTSTLAVASFAALITFGCSAPESEPIRGSSDTPPVEVSETSDRSRIESLVTDFGASLKRVSVLAPDAGDQIRSEWRAYIAAPLLERWVEDPAASPGRMTSSPWPDRIEIQDVVINGAAATVSGHLIESTSTGDSAARPVTIILEKSGGEWRITGFAAESGPDAGEAAGGNGESEDAGSDMASAVAVIRDYYAAIAERRFDDAWSAWGADGAPGQTREMFERGFRDTESTAVETGDPSRIEGAAGSRYIRIPVMVTAETTAGETQSYRGSYTLRRSVVDGAMEAQRTWHLYDAEIRRVD